MSALGNGSGYSVFKADAVLPTPTVTATSGGQNLVALKSDKLIGGRKRRSSKRGGKSKSRKSKGGRKSRRSRK